MEFCKSFNDKTKNFKESTPIPVVITAFSGSDTLAPVHIIGFRFMF
jgi:ribosomal protein L11